MEPTWDPLMLTLPMEEWPSSARSVGGSEEVVGPAGDARGDVGAEEVPADGDEGKVAVGDDVGVGADAPEAPRRRRDRRRRRWSSR